MSKFMVIYFNWGKLLHVHVSGIMRAFRGLLQSVTGYLRLTLLLMLYFGAFLLVLAKFCFWQGDDPDS